MKAIQTHNVVRRDENLHSMRSELQAAVSELTSLLEKDDFALQEVNDEIIQWDSRWDKCRLYLEQDELSVSTMEAISNLQIIALRNLESAQELQKETVAHRNSIKNQISEAEVSIKKLNSIEAHQMLLTAHRMDSPGTYEELAEFRAIRQKIATVQGFISLREQ